MSTSDYIRFRVNHEDKVKARELFEQMGFNLTQAFNVFLKQSLIEGGLPFQPHLKRKQKIPNAETLAAFKEVEEGRTIKVSNTSDLFKNLND